jgi:hypothetical protein
MSCEGPLTGAAATPLTDAGWPLVPEFVAPWADEVAPESVPAEPLRPAYAVCPVEPDGVPPPELGLHPLGVVEPEVLACAGWAEYPVPAALPWTPQWLTVWFCPSDPA